MSTPNRPEAAYTCGFEQLFNVFGAPGIPNEYQATLWRDGRAVQSRKFWWRRKAENQCLRWVRLYGAEMLP